MGHYVGASARHFRNRCLHGSAAFLQPLPTRQSCAAGTSLTYGATFHLQQLLLANGEQASASSLAVLSSLVCARSNQFQSFDAKYHVRQSIAIYTIPAPV